MHESNQYVHFTRQDRELTGAGSIVEVVGEGREVPHREQVVDGRLVFGSEDRVDVRNDGLDVGRAVLGHVLKDGLEVSPVVARCGARVRY